MTQSPQEHALLGRLRAGADDAFRELFEQHEAAVRRLARSLSADASEVEDITAETFFRVLRAIKRGNGPNDNIRGYLLTVARRVAWEWHGNVHDVPVTDDELTSKAGTADSNVAKVAERNLITSAFASLPERWRIVLWQTEVEGAQPAVVAPAFGLSPNATAALARRARQGLRAAYLQAHLGSNSADGGCRAVRDKLGGYTAGSLNRAEQRRISAHLGTCARCRSTHDELRDVCYSLRAHSGAVAVAVPTLAAAAAAGPSVTGAVKAFLVGAKVKVGAALASTAAVGAMGLTAGLAMTEEAVETLGLNGQQGVDASVQRAEPTGGGPTFADASSSHRTTSDAGSPPPTSTSEPAAQPDVVSSTDRSARSTATSSPQQQSTAVDDVVNSATRDIDTDVDRPEDQQRTSTEPPIERTTTGSSEPTSTTESPEPTSTTESPEPTDTTTSTPTDSPSSETTAAPTTSTERCVDGSYRTETYNAEEQRTEIYEYSYEDGRGYEKREHYYDDGRTYTSERYWYDDC